MATGEAGAGSSQMSHVACERMTGMRWWNGAIVALAAVVMIVQESTTSPVALSVHWSQRPARARTPPAFGWTQTAYFSGPFCTHS